MDTYYAPFYIVDEEELAFEINFVNENAIMSGLLHSISGVLAILNEKRQVVALNDSFLQMLGIDNPQEYLGLRLGEILECIHANEEPSGCGTTEFCSSCGAAVAIVSSIGQDKPVERTCALTTKRGGKMVDMALLVRSHPIEIDKERFLLLFLQDITEQQQRAALERTFFHDVSNMLSMLLMASELLIEKNPEDLAKTIHDVSLRLHKEVEIQRYLTEKESYNYTPTLDEIKTEPILGELQSFFTNHPIAREKRLKIEKAYNDISINTDRSLLLRVLCNMIINALEATEKNGVVKIWLEREDNFLSFCVWNAQEISQEVAKRIFQRNFSTKDQPGRGIGTYSMKLFGEKILGGKVIFTTSKAGGTIFRLALPI